MSHPLSPSSLVAVLDVPQIHVEGTRSRQKQTVKADTSYTLHILHEWDTKQAVVSPLTSPSSYISIPWSRIYTITPLPQQPSHDDVMICYALWREKEEWDCTYTEGIVPYLHPGYTYNDRYFFQYTSSTKGIGSGWSGESTETIHCIPNRVMICGYEVATVTQPQLISPPTTSYAPSGPIPSHLYIEEKTSTRKSRKSSKLPTIMEEDEDTKDIQQQQQQQHIQAFLSHPTAQTPLFSHPNDTTPMIPYSTPLPWHIPPTFPSPSPPCVPTPLDPIAIKRVRDRRIAKKKKAEKYVQILLNVVGIIPGQHNDDIYNDNIDDVLITRSQAHRRDVHEYQQNDEYIGKKRKRREKYDDEMEMEMEIESTSSFHDYVPLHLPRANEIYPLQPSSSIANDATCPPRWIHPHVMHTSAFLRCLDESAIYHLRMKRPPTREYFIDDMQQPSLHVDTSDDTTTTSSDVPTEILPIRGELQSHISTPTSSIITTPTSSTSSHTSPTSAMQYDPHLLTPASHLCDIHTSYHQDKYDMDDVHSITSTPTSSMTITSTSVSISASQTTSPASSHQPDPHLLTPASRFHDIHTSYHLEKYDMNQHVHSTVAHSA